MHSCLTKDVFRAITAGQPFRLSGCRQVYSRWPLEASRQHLNKRSHNRQFSISSSHCDIQSSLSQLDREIELGRLEHARSTYNQLASEQAPGDKSDGPPLNRLLTAICLTPDPDSEIVNNVLDTILERKLHLDPATLRALCRFWLLRDNLGDAREILKLYIDSFSPIEKDSICKTFQDFVLEQNNKSAHKVFDAYELLRTLFPKLPTSDRTAIMHSFFDRERPDLGCLVFGHMRQQDALSARPTAEIYGQCFEGIAKCKARECLQMVYNMLKLDIHVEPNTRIRNGLMAAYSACDEPYTAITDHFWKILNSWEGPTMGSFALALRACETWVPQGASEARKIIAMMQDWSVDITKTIYDCYIGAIAGQCEFENTVELIEEMESSIGVAPDAFTIGTFYNAIPWQYRKDEVENWARKAYPQPWQELVDDIGEQMDEDWGIRYFKIDRAIHAGPGDELLYNVGEYVLPLGTIDKQSKSGLPGAVESERFEVPTKTPPQESIQNS